MARPGLTDPDGAFAILDVARRRGLAAIDTIIQQHAVPRGWPADVAHAYLTRHLTYGIGERELDAVRTFHRMAVEEGLTPAARELKVWKPR
jgi:hypothetical protein